MTVELDSFDRDDTIHIYVSPRTYTGMLFIGDPHIESRTPGFRRDNYPEAILQKVQWAMEYAHQHQLQPILLGDVFDKPRDNPNWILSRLLDLFSPEPVPTIFGNHDCANPQLDENDSLMLLAKAGAVKLIDDQHLWACSIENRWVVLGGSPYRHPIPIEWSLATTKLSVQSVESLHRESILRTIQTHATQEYSLRTRHLLMLWLTHHDLTFPNAEEAVVTNLAEIPGIDFVINGHIHRRASADVVRGQTTWMNPGNIARRSRSDSIRGHVPAVMRLDITHEGQWFHTITVPHESPEVVFYDLENVDNGAEDGDRSSFISGLALLQARKTDSGAGLIQFLEENLSQFDQEVAAEIMRLAELVVAESMP